MDHDEFEQGGLDNKAIVYSREACDEVSRRVREYLARIRTATAEKQEVILETEKKSLVDVLGMFFAFLFHTVPFPFIFKWAVKYRGLGMISFIILGLFWIFFTFRFAVRLLNGVLYYFTMTGKTGTKIFAEQNAIVTFPKMKAAYEQRLLDIRENLQKMDTLERLAGRRQGLSKADFERMNALSELPDRRNEAPDEIDAVMKIWKTRTFTIKDWYRCYKKIYYKA